MLIIILDDCFLLGSSEDKLSHLLISNFVGRAERGTLTFEPASQLRVVDRYGNVTLVDDGDSGDLDGIQNDIILYKMSDEPVFI